MKANELMICDWVYYKDKEQMPCRVISISRNSIRFDDGTPQDWMSDVKNFTPIPLTEEILEKNGFAIKEKWAQIGNFGDSPLIMWHFADDYILGHYKTELEVHQNDTGKVHVRIPCEYVHQLQHALRLCNIEKEIEL